MTTPRYGRETDGPTPREWAEAVLLLQRMRTAASRPAPPTEHAPPAPAPPDTLPPPAQHAADTAQLDRWSGADATARPGTAGEPWTTTSGPPAPPAPLVPFDTEAPPLTPPWADPAAPEREPQLPAPLGLARALRPLGRRRTSTHRFDLDEERTATRAAEQGYWEPVFQGAQENYFDLALVVEDSVSMSVWSGTARALTRLFQQQGAFTDVRTWRLDTWHPEGPVLHTERGTVARTPRELVHPARRRIVLVLSDCVGEPWSSGAVPGLLHLWARHGPVAVLNPLPSHMWDRCDAVPVDVTLQAPTAALPNSALGLRAPRPRPHNDAQPPVPVPVLEIEPEWLASWAALVTGAGTGWQAAAALLTRPGGLDPRSTPVTHDTHDSVTQAADELAPDQRVRAFRAAASPAAGLLAAHLALAPLTLDVMQHVKSAVLPRVGPLPLAEVLLSGLLERTATPDAALAQQPSPAPDFTFRDGVRNQLLGGLGRAELYRALQGVTAVAARAMGADPSLLTRQLLSPERPFAFSLTPAERELAAAAQPALAALGRPYSALAERVRSLLMPSASPPRRGSGTNPWGEREENEMAGTARDPQSSEAAGPHPGTSAGGPGNGASLTESATGHSSAPGRSADTGSHSMPPSRAPGGVPLPNANFTGREAHLRQLRAELSENRSAAVLPQALYGLGGVGKTQLAIEYIRRHAEEYDLVWWVRAEQPAVIRSSLAALGSILGIKEGSDVDGAVNRVIAALASGHPVRRWLLVLDNALGPEEVTPYIPHMVGVPGGAGHVIITSRDAGWADRVRAVKVDVFTRDESITFLRRRGDMAEADAGRLADALGDLPLAVDQAAAWQASTGVALDEYLELLEHHRTDLLAETAGGGSRPVSAVWQVSMSSLRDRNPGALELLRLLAHFGPDPIPQSLLHNARLLNLPDALAATVRDPLSRSRAIRDIGRYSLLTIDNGAGTVQLHRLVRSVLQDSLDAQSAEELRHATHLLLAAHDPGDPEVRRNWDIYGEILPHAESSGMLTCDQADVRHTVLNLIRCLLARGDLRSGGSLARHAHETWTRTIGPDELQTISAARLLAATLRSRGSYREARDITEDALQRLRATVGEEHEDTLSATGALAADERATGDFAAALTLDETAYRMSKRVFGSDDVSTLTAGHNYAVSLRISGLFFKARELDHRVWQVRTMVLGATSRSTLFTLNNYARDMRECGQYAESRSRQEETVALYYQHYGEDHPHTLRALKNLSVANRKAGDFARGLELAVSVLESYRQRDRELQPDTIAALTNLGNDLRLTGDLQGAARTGLQALDNYRETVGDHHPFTYVAALNHAVVLRALGETPRAHRLDQETVAGITEALWPDHPWVLMARANLATGMARLGDTAGSRELNTEISGRLTELLGETHPTTLAVRRNLALDLAAAGEDRQAGELSATVLDQYRGTLGENHPETRGCAAGVRAEMDIEPPPL
ncbi:FxSxx-COOH system tetratricopeptide repeat protein [Streptomyces sp. NPDC058045]|uniref:FxSxx-COOH system tetratricopeptide repeat protein n=1 Tax=Streptomyces sp. NPDC058045 TaxID=3346311 RepID=UPI0036E1DA43